MKFMDVHQADESEFTLAALYVLQADTRIADRTTEGSPKAPNGRGGGVTQSLRCSFVLETSSPLHRRHSRRTTRGESKIQRNSLSDTVALKLCSCQTNHMKQIVFGMANLHVRIYPCAANTPLDLSFHVTMLESLPKLLPNGRFAPVQAILGFALEGEGSRHFGKVAPGTWGENTFRGGWDGHCCAKFLIP